MGAMENKGLNIFNSKYVLCDEATATDSAILGVSRVVAHECALPQTYCISVSIARCSCSFDICSRYLHNWTGNRVTVRDWFQLCLKEGLTVFRCAAPSFASQRAGISCRQLNVCFRDQQFSTSLTSSLDNRLQQVRTLLATQFAEDAGPLAHAVRPQSYVEINNFYTSTVYEKGAELCRMMHVIIGAAAFRTGMDLYFETYDGQAVTMEDWVDCMLQAASSHRASFVPSKQQWMLWCAFLFLAKDACSAVHAYSTAGTAQRAHLQSTYTAAMTPTPSNCCCTADRRFEAPHSLLSFPCP